MDGRPLVASGVADSVASLSTLLVASTLYAFSIPSRIPNHGGVGGLIALALGALIAWRIYATSLASRYVKWALLLPVALLLSWGIGFDTIKKIQQMEFVTSCCAGR